MNHIRAAAALGFCGILFFSAMPVRAQVTATLLGTARDSSGAVLPHVKVTATNVETNQVQESTTNTAGEYRMLALPAGRYKVEAEVTGFQKFLEQDVVLTVNEQHSLDIVMQVGSLQQQVEVEANAVQVETASTQMGNVISDKAMASLPLNGRSYIDLFSIQAGVAPQAPGSSSSTGYAVNGQRGSSNAFLVNGGNVNEGVNFGSAVIPNLDSIAEFRLVTNSFDPQYGRYSGAVMNAITKSGTNGFHGAAFEFLRNSDMDSRSFFNVGVSVLKRNQFGYAIGGPAWKNKIFWFTDYQGTRQVQGSSSSLTQLPTAGQRAGQFDTSDLSGTVSGPYWAQVLSQRLGYTVTNNEPYTQVFPGGVIPNKAMSPIALNYLQKYIPLPNQPDGGYLIPSTVSPSNDNKAAQRVDFINKKTGNWYGYYHFDDSSSVSQGTFGAQYGNFGSGTYSLARSKASWPTRA